MTGGTFFGRTMMTFAARAGITLAAGAGAAPNNHADATVARTNRRTRDSV
jgi:hypothetical protein